MNSLFLRDWCYTGFTSIFGVKKAISGVGVYLARMPDGPDTAFFKRKTSRFKSGRFYMGLMVFLRMSIVLFSTSISFVFLKMTNDRSCDPFAPNSLPRFVA